MCTHTFGICLTKGKRDLGILQIGAGGSARQDEGGRLYSGVSYPNIPPPASIASCLVSL